MARFTGAFPAIVTPMKNGEVDVPALKDLAAWQVAEGMTGIVPCGTTGEGATLTPEETLTVVRAVKDAVGGEVPLIVGTGSNDTARTIALTQKVKELGVDAALVVTPYYNKPSPEGLYLHYQAVAKEGGLPVVMYNVPGRTGTDMSLETIVRCAGIDGVVGIKDASKTMEKDLEIRMQVPEGFSLLSGDDFTILPFVACGGDGVVTVVGNMAPKDTAGVVSAFAAGDVAEARRLQAKLLPLTRALFAESNPIPVKAGLAMMGRITEAYRLPLCPPSDGARATLKAAMQAYGGLL